MKARTYIGIALDQGLYCVDARRAGQAPARMTFPADERGGEQLRRYVAGLREPVRLAILASVATLGLALALGDVPEREIILVSPQVADQAADLAAFAVRTV